MLEIEQRRDLRKLTGLSDSTAMAQMFASVEKMAREDFDLPEIPKEAVWDLMAQIDAEWLSKRAKRRRGGPSPDNRGRFLYGMCKGRCDKGTAKSRPH